MSEIACTVGPLDHSRWGDPEHCCDLGEPKVHRFHPRHADWRTRDAIISCCCKSVTGDTEWLAAQVPEGVSVPRRALDALIEYANGKRDQSDSQFLAGIAEYERSQQEFDELIAALKLP